MSFDPRVFDNLRQLLSDPTTNLTAAAIGISIVVLLLIIIVLALIAWVMPARVSNKRRKKPRRKRTGTQAKAGPRSRAAASEHPSRASVDGLTADTGARRARWRVPWIALSLVVAAAGVIAAYATTSTNQYCTTLCHQMIEPAQTWKTSAHRSVPCVRCHEGAIGVSAPQGLASRSHSIFLAITDSSAPPTPVPAGRCLACHDDIADRVITTSSAVRMSHAEVLASGADCLDCHEQQGHVGGNLTIPMSTCLRCHDGRTAPATCATCHPSGVEASIATSEDRSFGDAVKLPEKPTCEGCHSLKSCDKCHGLRMPHPRNFPSPYEHAKLAAFEGKELCYRCHSFQECSECHSGFDSHGQGWKSRHATYPWNAPYCNWCHETSRFCEVCHDKR